MLLALAEKDIPVTKHRVNLGVFENYSEWFMKINPKGKVPVLIDEGKIIPDSSDIIQYLDDTYGKTIETDNRDRIEMVTQKCMRCL